MSRPADVLTYRISYGGISDSEDINIYIDFDVIGSGMTLTPEQLADAMRDAIAADISDTVTLTKLEVVPTNIP